MGNIAFTVQKGYFFHSDDQGFFPAVQRIGVTDIRQGFFSPDDLPVFLP